MLAFQSVVLYDVQFGYRPLWASLGMHNGALFSKTAVRATKLLPKTDQIKFISLGSNKKLLRDLTFQTNSASGVQRLHESLAAYHIWDCFNCFESGLWIGRSCEGKAGANVTPCVLPMSRKAKFDCTEGKKCLWMQLLSRHHTFPVLIYILDLVEKYQ